jgi:H+/Cl- antiporter ClcA
MNNEETFFYLSTTYKSELYKILMFTGIAGFIGGLLDNSLQKHFANNIIDSERSLSIILLQYIGNGLFCSLATIVLVYTFFDSSIQSMKTIRTIYLYSIPMAIICPSLFTITLRFFSNSIYPQDKD